jgi:ABC-2 type transport system permease protein
MYVLLFKNFIRSRSVLAALILFLTAGVISIFIGKQFLSKQAAAIESVTRFQQEHIERNTHYVKDEFGLLMYYLKFAYINKPAPISGLAIGQQDVNTTIQSITIRGLEAQRYDTDLYNPYNLMTGNFDLSFVIIFLLPLLIIAFNYNLLSQEKESGTWFLVNTQANDPLQFIAQKLSIRFIIVFGLLLSLLVLAKCILAIPVDNVFVAYSVTAILYSVIWFGISFLIITLRKHTNINALLLLSTWVMLCLLVPGLVNNYITAKYAVPEAYSTFLKQRDGYHTKWDANKDSTIQAFFKHYPQYKDQVWNKPTFNYLWFYAMQQLGDEEAREESKAMQQKLLKRVAVSTRAGLLSPVMYTQLQFSQISNTGLQHHLQYQDSTAAFHERLKRYFYPKIFGDSAVSNENWEKHVPAYFTATNSIQWLPLLWPLLLMTLVLYGAGILIFKRQ